MSWQIPIGVVLVALVLGDVFEVIVLPRRIVRRLRIATLFYRASWTLWSACARRMPTARWRAWFLSLYGPLSLLALLLVWATGIILGFALIFNGTHCALTGRAHGLGPCLYLSGVTFFTLGYGDVAPLGGFGRFLSVFEAGVGFGTLAVVIGYLPVIYQAFSRRELTIAMLDARAGSPPSAEVLLTRYAGQHPALEQLLRDWEEWISELMESHISYPVLGYFRSQHDNQSWVTSLATVLDSCVLVIAILPESPAFQAKFTFALARHALVDLAQVFNTPPDRTAPPRLEAEGFERLGHRLAEAGWKVDEAGCGERADRLRQLYEPYLFSLADRLFVPLPSWTAPETRIENWQTSAWERLTSQAVRTLVRNPADDHEA
jgi:hypothetical protein